MEERLSPSFGAIGSEFRVSTTTTGDQLWPGYASRTIALSPKGDCAVVWQSFGQDGAGWGIFGQRYNSAGAALAGEFRVNLTTAGDQVSPAVATDAAGNFVVAWAGPDGDGYGIYARRFTAAGAALGGDVRVNQTTSNEQAAPAVAADADGNFVVAWHTIGQDGDGVGVFARRFSFQGAPRSGEFLVNQINTGSQAVPDVAVSAVGDFVVVWQGPDADGNGIFGRRFAANGAAQGNDFPVSATTTGEQSLPAVAIDAVGNFAVAWQSAGQDNSGDAAVARAYFANGTPRTGELIANTHTTNHQSQPAIGMDVDGDFIVAWASLGQDAEDFGVYAQRFTPAGVHGGGEFRVNSFSTNAQSAPMLAASADGDFVVAWTSVSQDGSNAGVYAQRYQDADDNNDTAGPWITGVWIDGAALSPHPPIAENDRLVNPVMALTVGFSEPAVSSGSGSPLSAANWDLRRDGVPVQLTAIALDATGRLAVLTPAAPLGEGGYLLTARSSMTDVAGNLLDGQRDGDVFGEDLIRHFTVSGVFAVGSDVPANTFTTMAQDSPAVAGDAGGNFVVAWTDRSGRDGDRPGIIARRYSAAGSAQGSEILVNGVTTGAQQSPAIAVDAVGNFIIAWESDGPEGGGFGIYARRFSAAGVPIGGDFAVNQYTTDDQRDPAIAIDASGDFVVVWTSFGQDGDSEGVFARRFSAAGFPQGNELPVNTSSFGAQIAPAVAADAAGNFTVAWERGGEIFARQFSALGAPLGDDFQVNLESGGDQTHPAVAADTGGNFAVAWQSNGQDGDGDGIYLQRFDAAGMLFGPELRVNTWTTGSQAAPALAADSSGDLVVAWSSFGQDGSDRGIFARQYDAAGNAAGDEIPVNSIIAGRQFQAAVATDADGDFAVAWAGPDGSGDGILARRFQASALPRVTNVSVNDGAAQRSRVTRVTVTFDRLVALPANAANAFTLLGPGGNIALTADLSPSIPSQTIVRLSFGGPGTEFSSLADGLYSLTVRSNQIIGGLAGGDYVFNLHRLFGDNDGDQDVDAQDFLAFRITSGLSSADPGFNPSFDFEGDNDTDASDFLQFRTRFGTSV